MEQLKIITIENEFIRLKILNYGLRILEFSVLTPDKIRRNLVLEYSDFKENFDDEICLNSIVNTNLNKEGIDKEKICLHNKYFEIYKEDNSIISTLNIDGVSYEIKYELKENNLIIKIKAIPKEEMALDISQNTFFNLNGDSTVKDHYFTMKSDLYFELNEQYHPTNKVVTENTAFDFNNVKRLGDILNVQEEQFKISKNINHSYLLKDKTISLFENKFGISLTVNTDADHVEVCLGNYLGSNPTRMTNGRILRDYSGILLKPHNNDKVIKKDNKYSIENPYTRTLVYTVESYK